MNSNSQVAVNAFVCDVKVEVCVSVDVSVAGLNVLTDVTTAVFVAEVMDVELMSVLVLAYGAIPRNDEHADRAGPSLPNRARGSGARWNTFHSLMSVTSRCYQRRRPRGTTKRVLTEIRVIQRERVPADNDAAIAQEPRHVTAIVTAWSSSD
jgi:hypothetical protein